MEWGALVGYWTQAIGPQYKMESARMVWAFDQWTLTIENISSEHFWHFITADIYE